MAIRHFRAFSEQPAVGVETGVRRNQRTAVVAPFTGIIRLKTVFVHKNLLVMAELHALLFMVDRHNRCHGDVVEFETARAMPLAQTNPAGLTLAIFRNNKYMAIRRPRILRRAHVDVAEDRPRDRRPARVADRTRLETHSVRLADFVRNRVGQPVVRILSTADHICGTPPRGRAFLRHAARPSGQLPAVRLVLSALFKRPVPDHLPMAQQPDHHDNRQKTFHLQHLLFSFRTCGTLVPNNQTQ